MKILVTGAAGYLGARISDYFAHAGHEVIALIRTLPSDSQKWQQKISTWITGDIRDSALQQRLADLEPDVVIHTISLNHKDSEKDPSIALESNVTPVWNLLDHLSKKGHKHRFFYLSTQQVYGRLHTEHVDENFPLHPLNNYGLTHLLCEQVCHFYNHQHPQMDCVSLRLSNGFGAPLFLSNDCWWLVLNDFCKSAWESGKIILKSDGTPQRNFIHILDICHALELLCEAPLPSNQSVFNLGGEFTKTMLELAHLVAQVFEEHSQKSIPVFLPNGLSHSSVSHQHIKRFFYDSQQLSKLGYVPQVRLQTGIEEILHFLQNSYTA